MLDGCRWTAGKIGGGLEFDGAKDSVAVGAKNLLGISDNFSIVFWANPKAPRASTRESESGEGGKSGQRYALFPRNAGEAGHAGAGLSVGANGVSVFERADGYLPSMLVVDCPLSGWNHITVVYRNRQPTLYLNGACEKAGCKSTKAVHPTFDLGGPDFGRYAGTLDDIRVYDRALTHAEIQANYSHP